MVAEPDPEVPETPVALTQMPLRFAPPVAAVTVPEIPVTAAGDTVTWSVLEEPPLGLTDAWLDSTVPADAVTLTVREITAGVPETIDVVDVQVTAWPTAEQLNPPPEPEAKVSPVGRVSVTVTVPEVGPPELDTDRL